MPGARGKFGSGCLTPAISGDQKEEGKAKSPLHSRGSPAHSAGSTIGIDPHQRETKSKVAASPLPSRGPKIGQMCYVTPTYSRIPNAQREEQNQKWLPQPYLLGGPKEGRNAMSPCILGDPECEARGPKSEVVPNKGEQNQKWLPHPCPSPGPKTGRKCYVTLHSWGSRMCSPGTKIRSGCRTPAPPRGPKAGGNAMSPCILGDPECVARGPKSEVVPNKGEQNLKWLPHPCLLGGAKIGHKCYVSPASSRTSNAKCEEQNQKWSPTNGSKITSACLTPAFTGPQNRAEMLCHRCIPRDPQCQAQGVNWEVAASPLPFRETKRKGGKH